MHESKKRIRKPLVTARRALPAALVDSNSKIICNYAFRLIDWTSVKSVCIYEAVPGTGEINVEPLLSMLAELPMPPEITIVASHSKAPFPVGIFDVVIVPVLAFDDENHRLGQGGGWYDRFLTSQSQACTIGLAHAEFKTTFPHETHDIPLDFIITEQGSQTAQPYSQI